MSSSPPIVEIPHVEAAMDPTSIAMEEMRSVRAHSPRATFGEAGTFWDSSTKMSHDLMRENALALVGREAVYLMRREGGTEWIWYCGLLSSEKIGETLKYKVTLSRTTSLLRGVYQHSGADETFDFPHLGFEYAHVVSKDVYWNMWAERTLQENDEKFTSMNKKVEEMEMRMALMLSQQAAQYPHQAQQSQQAQQQQVSQGVDPTLTSVLTLLAQNQQMCQVQIQQRDDMLRRKGAEVCLLSPENVECIELELAADATNMLQWREILVQGYADRLLSKLESKYWSAHSGKLETRELRELKNAFGVVRDTIQAVATTTSDWVSSKPLIRSMNKSLESLILKWEYTTKRISADDIERLVKSGKTFEKAVKLAEIDAEKKFKNERNGKGGKGRNFGSWNPQNNFRGRNNSNYGFQGNVGGAGKGQK